MRIISLDKLKTGDILGKSLFNERGELLLSSGYALTDRMVELIRKQGYNYVYVMDDVSEDIVPETVISESVRQIVNRQLAQTFDGVKNNLAFEAHTPEEIKKRLRDESKARKLIRMPSVRKQVNQLLEEIFDNNISMFTSLPVRSEAGEDYQHAFEVAVMSILLGQVFRYNHREMRALGAAALVHDIGKMAFPRLKGKTYDQLSREERMILHEHPTYSMMILRGSDPSSYLEQTTVLQHHEQQDGRGYPQGLQGTGEKPAKAKAHEPLRIFRFAEILAVANRYDNLLTGTLDGEKKSPAEAIATLVNEAGTRWNPHVVRALTQVVQTYPVGATVRIKKTYSRSYIGYIGVIKKANMIAQNKPVIVLFSNAVGAKITPREVDLSNEKTVTLELVI